jgi:hypothetical protein
MRNWIFIILICVYACSVKEKKDEGDSEPKSLTDSVSKTESEEEYMDELPGPNFTIDSLFPKKIMEEVDSLVRIKNNRVKGIAADYHVDYLNAVEIRKLPTEELIYYCLSWPGVFSQICGDSYDGDTTTTPKIYSTFITENSEVELTQLQKDELDQRDDSVTLVLDQLVSHRKRLPPTRIIEMLYNFSGWKSIPVIIQKADATDKENTDAYIYLVKCVQNYEPFKKTVTYKKLYGPNSSTYRSKIVATKEVMQEIKDLALQFYKENKK